MTAGWHARIDEVISWGEGRARELFSTLGDAPDGVRLLAQDAVLAWGRAGGLERLDLPSLQHAFFGITKEGQVFDVECQRVFRRRALAQPTLDMDMLLSLARGVEAVGPFDGTERARFQEAWSAMLARDRHTLREWTTARARGLVSESEFAEGVMGPFRRALAAGFRDENDHGDNFSFIDSAAAVGGRDPDLCLRGLVALSDCYNENGLRQYLPDWERLVPKTGFSPEVIAEVSQHFSDPRQRGAAKLLGKFLAGRGIAVVHPKPPVLGQVDQTFVIGTDVAHVVIGSPDAVEAVAEKEDPDDWPTMVKRHKAVGVRTGGDGTFRVRVIGCAEPGESARPTGKHIGTFPLVVTEDALTVSGIVGAGGTPTVPFPSGKYAADFYVDGSGTFILMLAPTQSLPKWTLGKDLPLA